MGVDYNGVGGVGIELTQDMIKDLIKRGIFTEDAWEDDWYSVLEELKLPGTWEGAGDYCYTGGDPDIYLFPEGGTLTEVLENEEAFYEGLAKIGINISRKDMLIISEMSVT